MRCVQDILAFLQKLNVKNVPASWYKLKKSLLICGERPTETYICSNCEDVSTTNDICSQCQVRFSLARETKSFCSFPITDQLKKIISLNQGCLFNSSVRRTDGTMRDICDGKVYQDIQLSVGEHLITLTMNIDGIEPNRNSHQTIWPILLVINELPMKKRFAIENILVAGIWPGCSKPKRTDIYHLLRPVIDEFLLLENSHELYFNNVNGESVRGRVLLIGCCLDKPAQALVQCLPEPIAAYGCGRCEVHGAY